MQIVSLFCEIDAFFLEYEAYVSSRCLPSEAGSETRGRPRNLHPSEVMTIFVAFHQSNYPTFKHFYEKHVCVYWGAAFPHLVSYSRFVQRKKEVLTLLAVYLATVLASVAVCPSWIRHVCGFPITGGLPHIASSQVLRNARKPLWGGFTGSNFTLLSITQAISWMSQ